MHKEKLGKATLRISTRSPALEDRRKIGFLTDALSMARAGYEVGAAVSSSVPFRNMETADDPLVIGAIAVPCTLHPEPVAAMRDWGADKQDSLFRGLRLCRLEAPGPDTLAE